MFFLAVLQRYVIYNVMYYNVYVTRAGRWIGACHRFREIANLGRGFASAVHLEVASCSLCRDHVRHFGKQYLTVLLAILPPSIVIEPLSRQH